MFSLSASDDTPPYMYEQSVSWYVVMFFKNVRVLMSSASTFASQMLGGRFSFLIILGLVSYDREWPRVSSSESERLLNEPLRGLPIRLCWDPMTVPSVVTRLGGGELDVVMRQGGLTLVFVEEEFILNRDLDQDEPHNGSGLLTLIT
ncbi:hypothetical protein Tco_0529903 [Tanacetum coccineum]